MKRNIIFAALAVAGLMLSSCENDFNAKIYGSLSTTNFPSSESDYENYMMDCYVPYCIKWTYTLSSQTHNFYVPEGSIVRLLDGTSDYCAPWVLGGSWGDSWKKLTSGSFEDMKYYTRAYSGYPEDFGKTRDVTVMTKIIGVLENAPESKLSAAKKAQFLGEARLCRGLMMYYLMQYFGPVPVIVDPAKVGDEESEKNLTRPTLDAYTQYITDDFEFAANNVPEKQSQKGRYTADYARFCLMRHYLNEGYHMNGYYQKAADLFSKFTGGYKLYTDGTNPYADQFKIAHKFNCEVIMAVSCSTAATGTGTQGNFNPWSWYFVPKASKVDPNGNPTPFYYQGGGWGQCFNIDPQYYKTFEDGDLRRETILTSYYNTQNKLVGPSDIGNLWDGYIVNKYPIETATSFQGTDFPLARWADVLLLYAEALTRAGNSVNATAIDCVNQVRARAGLAKLTSDKTSSTSNFLDAILAERGHELMYEGCRKVDLIRFGKYYTTMKAYGRTPSSEYFPIPNYAIDQATAAGSTLDQYFYTSNYDGPTK